MEFEKCSTESSCIRKLLLSGSIRYIANLNDGLMVINCSPINFKVLLKAIRGFSCTFELGKSKTGFIFFTFSLIT